METQTQKDLHNFFPSGEGRRSLREVAESAQCAKSTVLRRVRKLEKKHGVILLHPDPNSLQGLQLDVAGCTTVATSAVDGVDPQYDQTTLARHDKENYEELRVVRRGEPIVAKLRLGLNELSQEEFRAAVNYLTESERVRRKAFGSGRFEIGKIVIQRSVQS